MKTSARNEFTGTITDIKKGMVSAEAIISLKGGATLVATVTEDAVAELNLKKGDSVTAIVKASWIIIASEKPSKISARNCIEGKVSAVKKGQVNCEIVLSLNGSDTLTAIITDDAAEDLGLSVGATAYALFKASNVILA